MKKNLKKLLSLMLIVALTGSLFTACGGDSGEKKKVTTLTKMNTTDDITLNYTFWQDIEIVQALEKEFEKLYPNIDVVPTEFEVGNNNAELIALAAANNLPDCFWILGSPDVFITNALLMDMSRLWEADKNTEKDSSANVIKGINEYEIGYLGTVGKWTTPVKFFPTAAFVNMDAFARNNVDMPATDWTWAEYEDTIKNMTMTDKSTGKKLFGHTSACTVITWYPIAADKDCIGEFGWNGVEYDMENWAYGLELEADLINEGYKSLNVAEELAELYGEGVLYAQDEGYSAIHTDNWWTWEDFWITDPWIVDKHVIFVPYLMPHTEEAQGGNYIATMDMGGISPFTDYAREAYELLKFMTWGAQGWEYKLQHYPNIREASTATSDEETEEGAETEETESRLVSKNNCPITLNEKIWEGFIEWHPNSKTGDKQYADGTIKYDRAPYFDDFFEGVKNGTWTCYGGQQIPGFDTWLADVYHGGDGQQNYGYTGGKAYGGDSAGTGIESAVIWGGVSAYDYYEQLEEKGNQINKEKLAEIESYLQ